MIFQPLYDKVLVKKVAEGESITKGGIIMPEMTKDMKKSAVAVVIAVGTGRPLPTGGLVELNVKPGDRVMFGKFNGLEVDVDGEPYTLVAESEIYGIYKETE